jgi:hypothetical protein
MSAHDTGWLAGFFDGEGWYTEFDVTSAHGNHVRYHVICIGIGNTVKAAIDHCREVTGAGRIHLKYRDSSSRKPLWTWRLNKRADLIEVLCQIEPYLVIKGDRARRVLTELRAQRVIDPLADPL